VTPDAAFSAVILAAGESRRMGRPKAQLQYRGETFLDRLVRLFAAHCSQVIVVAQEALPAIRELAGQESCATFVANPHPERGMLSSLQCGLAAVANSAQAVFFIPVDHPAISDRTIRSLAAAWNGESLAIPRYQGRRGHPVLIARRMVPEFLGLAPTAQARDIVQRHAIEILYVDVDDPGVLADIDDPAAYRELLEADRA
jgi:molybdenum cofactor cytidylyltransferase